MLNRYRLTNTALVRAATLFLLACVPMVQGFARAEHPKGPGREASPSGPPRDSKKGAPAFPLKVAEGGRYLVDQSGTPFLIAGESPQALMANLTEKDAELFFANRVSHGFNAVWIN